MVQILIFNSNDSKSRAFNNLTLGIEIKEDKGFLSKVILGLWDPWSLTINLRSII